MKLSEAQKRVLRVLHSWGDCEVRIEKDSIGRDSVDVLVALQGHEYLRCYWGPFRIALYLTDKGREKAKELQDAQD